MSKYFAGNGCVGCCTFAEVHIGNVGSWLSGYGVWEYRRRANITGALLGAGYVLTEFLPKDDGEMHSRKSELIPFGEFSMLEEKPVEFDYGVGNDIVFDLDEFEF